MSKHYLFTNNAGIKLFNESGSKGYVKENFTHYKLVSMDSSDIDTLVSTALSFTSSQEISAAQFVVLSDHLGSLKQKNNELKDSSQHYLKKINNLNPVLGWFLKPVL